MAAAAGPAAEPFKAPGVRALEDAPLEGGSQRAQVQTSVMMTALMTIRLVAESWSQMASWR